MYNVLVINNFPMRALLNIYGATVHNAPAARLLKVS
jgi:hypothetical protein